MAPVTCEWKLLFFVKLEGGISGNALLLRAQTLGTVFIFVKTMKTKGFFSF